MAKELKVWGGVFDGRIRCIVAAPSKAAAARAFGIPISAMNGWGSETFNQFENETARAKPGQVFGRPGTSWDNTPFTERHSVWRINPPETKA